jgi:ring-1,2-phenylacetyl-CoA epoxidase subunit PaaB
MPEKNSDTQWPRFMVFEQAEDGLPFLHNGTVHAPDAEMALLNARDVFARRPDGVAFWVVPAEDIYTQTREELAKSETGVTPDLSINRLIDYYVFGKFEQQGHCRQVGDVNASSPHAAMLAAIKKYPEQAPLWWWVFPKDVVLSSEERDRGPMFAAARDKSYKDQAEYPVVTLMRELRAKANKDK